MVKTILKKAPTVGELADAIGVDPASLARTISRFNEHALEGKDPDFQRGEAAYDKMYGDYRHGPNPCLRPITEAPFYAMPIYPGDIGMNGGLTTNEKAQVTREDGSAIAGLYAIGNNAASVMGESYPGAGVTLGPAMTFGYIAARSLTGAN
jgi:3-oxosteroid 1-dehydrogenase